MEDVDIALVTFCEVATGRGGNCSRIRMLAEHLSSSWRTAIIYLGEGDGAGRDQFGCTAYATNHATRNDALTTFLNTLSPPGRQGRCAKPIGVLRDRLSRAHKRSEERATRECKRLLTELSGCAADHRDGEPTLLHHVSGRAAIGYGRLLSALRPRVVIYEYATLIYLHLYSQQHSRHQPSAAFVDTLDVLHLRAESFHSMGKKHWISISRREEEEILRAFDRVIAIQPEEALLLGEMVGPERVVCAPHAHVIHSAPDSPTHTDPPTILLVAGATDFNIDGLAWFLNEVLPIVRSSVTCRLVVAGRICGSMDAVTGGRKLPEGVSLLGEYDDADDVYRHAEIVVNPSRFGGGLKIKTVEALCYGKALVTTPCGCQGLEDGIGSAFLLARDASEMAGHIVQLILEDNTLQALQREAVAFSEEHFSTRMAYQQLTDRIRDALGPA